MIRRARAYKLSVDPKHPGVHRAKLISEVCFWTGRHDGCVEVSEVGDQPRDDSEKNGTSDEQEDPSY